VSPIIRRVVSAYGHADRPHRARADARTRRAARRGEASELASLQPVSMYRLLDTLGTIDESTRRSTRTRGRVEASSAEALKFHLLFSSVACFCRDLGESGARLVRISRGNRKELRHGYGSLGFPLRYYRAPLACRELYRVCRRQTLCNCFPITRLLKLPSSRV